MTSDPNSRGAILNPDELALVFHYFQVLLDGENIGTSGRALGGEIAVHLGMRDVFRRESDVQPVVVVEDTEEDE